MRALDTAAAAWGGSAAVHRGDPRVDVRAAELEAQSEALLARAERELAEARQRAGWLSPPERLHRRLSGEPRGRMDPMSADEGLDLAIELARQGRRREALAVLGHNPLEDV